MIWKKKKQVWSSHTSWFQMYYKSYSYKNSAKLALKKRETEQWNRYRDHYGEKTVKVEVGPYLII